MEDNYIAIDLGATSGRVILASLGKERKVQMQTIRRFPTPLVEKEGKFYWDINLIFENILCALTEVAERGVRVKSLGIDTWGVDFVKIDKDGKMLGLPRSYRDSYSFAAQEEFLSLMSREELYERTGIQIMNFNSVFQLFAQNKAGELDGTDKILFLPDALAYLLTGRMVCEYTILSTSALMNPRTKEFDERILELCSLDRNRFPQIVFPGAEIGPLKKDIVKRTGLKGVTVLAVAGHDTASVVAAIPARDRNFAYLSSGTWSLMGIETQQPRIDGQMFKLNFTNEGGVGGTVRLLKNITGMWILEQCLLSFKKEGKDYSFSLIANMAEAAEPSPHVFDPDDKAFAAPTDMPEAINSYMREHGWEAPADDATLFRLIYDSLATRYAEVLEGLKVLAPFEIDTLHIVGGGSQNHFLNSLTARKCGIRVVAGPSEGTALGNVMIQAGLSRSELLSSIETQVYQ